MVQEQSQPEDCGKFMKELLKCNGANKFTRFFGSCDTEERAYANCVKRENFRKRDESVEQSKARRKAV